MKRLQSHLGSSIGILALISISGCSKEVGSENSARRSINSKQWCVNQKSTLTKAPAIKNVGQYKTTVNAATSQPLQRLYGHVPPAVRRARKLRSIDSNRQLDIEIVMNLNHEDELNQMLSEIYNPEHPNYHHFLSPSEFAARFYPTEEQVKNVRDSLIARGIQPVESRGLIVHARGRANNIQTLFNTEVSDYVDPQGKKFFAPSYELQLPKGLAVQAVNGLSNRARVTHHLKNKELRFSPRDQSSSSYAGGALAYYNAADIRKVYNIPDHLNGAGSVLALVEFDGYYKSDISNYLRLNNLAEVPLQNILIDGFSGKPILDSNGKPGSGTIEVELDIELMIALAPKAQKILVYEAPNSWSGSLDMYYRIAKDNLAQSVSTSWGFTETELSPSERLSQTHIFMQMIAQGQTVFAAAGDNGAHDNGTSLSVDYPASDPFVVAVGGTTLFRQSDGSYDHETTWSGGGGGISISQYSKIPSWQAGVINPNSQASTTQRNLPDVSLNSDPRSGYLLYTIGSQAVWGGTSAAAPLWASFLALVNQQRSINGLQAIGFLNPYLYRMGASKNYLSDFHDVADNSHNGYYHAVSGFDNATGWGSFDGVNLIQDLSQPLAPAQITIDPEMLADMPQC